MCSVNGAELTRVLCIEASRELEGAKPDLEMFQKIMIG